MASSEELRTPESVPDPAAQDQNLTPVKVEGPVVPARSSVSLHRLKVAAAVTVALAAGFITDNAYQLSIARKNTMFVASELERLKVRSHYDMLGYDLRSPEDRELLWRKIGNIRESLSNLRGRDQVLGEDNLRAIKDFAAVIEEKCALLHSAEIEANDIRRGVVVGLAAIKSSASVKN